MDEAARVGALRDAAVALRRDWEEPELPGRWSDVAVWFGTLLLLGPRATRGVGAFASFVLISRTWAAAHRRHTRSVNHVLGLTVELVAADLEDRAAVDEAVDDVLLLAKQAHERLDGYTDAHEERHVILEERLDDLDLKTSGEEGTRTQPPYPFEDGDTLVIGPEAFVAQPGEAVISWRGENYYRADEPAPLAPLTVEEAVALRAAVRNGAFDPAVVDSAVAKIDRTLGYYAGRESPQSEEELGPEHARGARLGVEGESSEADLDRRGDL